MLDLVERAIQQEQARLLRASSGGAEAGAGAGAGAGAVAGDRQLASIFQQCHSQSQSHSRRGGGHKSGVGGESGALNYCRLDGSTSQAGREKALRLFRSEDR